MHWRRKYDRELSSPLYIWSIYMLTAETCICDYGLPMCLKLFKAKRLFGWLLKDKTERAKEKRKTERQGWKRKRAVRKGWAVSFGKVGAILRLTWQFDCLFHSLRPYSTFSLSVCLCLSGSFSSRASSIRGFSVLSEELPGLWSCLSEGPGRTMMMTPASTLSSPPRPDSIQIQTHLCRQKRNLLYCEVTGCSNRQKYSVIDSGKCIIFLGSVFQICLEEKNKTDTISETCNISSKMSYPTSCKAEHRLTI